MEIDYKKVFSNEQKYNSLKLFESSLYENTVTLYTELLHHKNKDELMTELLFIEKLLKLYEKFNKYKFCPDQFNNKFEVDDTEKSLLSKASVIELFQSLYDKLNLILDDFMGKVDYNPNRVHINGKTSVFLIAYATELKEFVSEFSDDFILNLNNHDFDNKIYREPVMQEKLKFVPVAGAKGVWAKGPLNFKS